MKGHKRCFTHGFTLNVSFNIQQPTPDRTLLLELPINVYNNSWFHTTSQATFNIQQPTPDRTLLLELPINVYNNSWFHTTSQATFSELRLTPDERVNHLKHKLPSTVNVLRRCTISCRWLLFSHCSSAFSSVV